MECMLKIVWNNFSVSPWMEWLKNCSCIFCTSYIHVGRMLKIVFVARMPLSRAMQEQLPRNDFSVSPWMEWLKIAEQLFQRFLR